MNRFCKPIRKPDAAGQAETGEIQRAGHDFTRPVGRGQRGDQRLPETAETYVGRLITQRPQVQSSPRYQVESRSPLALDVEIS